MARKKGASRRVISWTSVPAPVQRPGFSRSYDHTLLLECGHTVVKRFPEHAQFKFSDCPIEGCMYGKYDSIEAAKQTPNPRIYNVIVEWKGRTFVYYTVENSVDALIGIGEGVTVRAIWDGQQWQDRNVEIIATQITAEERLKWLQNALMTAQNGIFWFDVQRALGFTDEEFTAPGDVTLGECFNAAIDKRIRGLK